MKILNSYISGKYATSSLKLSDNKNPATSELVSKISLADQQSIDLAITSAREAYLKWQQFSAEKKSEVLFNIADKLTERNDELALLEVIDTGKPINEAKADDVKSAGDCFRFYAGLTDKIYGSQQHVSGGMFYTSKEPLGVCLGIGAWNYPLQIAAWKAAPCLAAGNSMIFKPSMFTPTTALQLAEIINQAGAPPGLFNVILGDNDISAHLVSRSEINKVSLTGSVATGKKVMAAAAKNLSPVTMELGGKSPLIIFDDCDLDKAVTTAVWANFYTQGEVCSNGTRVFVQSAIYNKFIAKAKELSEKIIVGDPMVENTKMGALISSAHLDKVLDYIEGGKSEGARLVCGGSRVSMNNGTNNHGYFVQPTIFADCHDEMTIAKEEIFGPVMSVFKFTTPEEVVARANATQFGLAAGVFTNNLSLAHTVTKQIQAGACWVNCYNIFPLSMPFGGYKNSGIGRENGLDGLNSYLQTKSIYIATE